MGATVLGRQEDSAPSAFPRAWPCPHLDFGLLASRAETVSILLTQPVCGLCSRSTPGSAHESERAGQEVPAEGARHCSAPGRASASFPRPLPAEQEDTEIPAVEGWQAGCGHLLGLPRTHGSQTDFLRCREAAELWEDLVRSVESTPGLGAGRLLNERRLPGGRPEGRRGADPYNSSWKGVSLACSVSPLSGPAGSERTGPAQGCGTLGAHHRLESEVPPHPPGPQGASRDSPWPGQAG